MDEKKGIKEFMEILEAAKSITFTSFDAFKDGFQLDDLAKFGPCFTKVKDAIKGYK